MKRHEHGGVILWLVVVAVGLFLVAGLFFGACDAFFDDESEENDLGAPVELVAQG